MSERKEIGKIKSVAYGFGGYDDAQFGLSLTFGGSSWGVGTFDGHWSFPPRERAQWTEADRMAAFAKTACLVLDTLKAAKVRHVDDLKDIPVEVTFEGNMLKSWRVLEEVL